jgi:predicted PurR-regulated permease PerM
MKWLEKVLWKKRSLAVTAMTLGLLGVIVVPAAVTVIALLENVDEIRSFAATLPTKQIPPAPVWLGKIPAVGDKAIATWTEASVAGIPALMEKMEPYMRSIASWIAGEFGSLGAFLVEFLLTVAITAIFFATGEQAVKGLRAFFRRLAGEWGDNSVTLAGGAIRGVAMGVVVTAVVQSLFAGLGLAIAGVPFTAALTALMLVLCIAQLGPLPVMALVTIWVFKTQGVGWGSFMAVWTLIAGTVNNFLQPMLIKKGADLPLLLIFAGVLGGLLSFGIIGLFVGPVLLAVTYTLLEAWVKADGSPA